MILTYCFSRLLHKNQISPIYKLGCSFCLFPSGRTHELIFGHLDEMLRQEHLMGVQKSAPTQVIGTWYNGACADTETTQNQKLLPHTTPGSPCLESTRKGVSTLFHPSLFLNLKH